MSHPCTQLSLLAFSSVVQQNGILSFQKKIVLQTSQLALRLCACGSVVVHVMAAVRVISSTIFHVFVSNLFAFFTKRWNVANDKLKECGMQFSLNIEGTTRPDFEMCVVLYRRYSLFEIVDAQSMGDPRRRLCRNEKGGQAQPRMQC